MNNPYRVGQVIMYNYRGETYVGRIHTLSVKHNQIEVEMHGDYSAITFANVLSIVHDVGTHPTHTPDMDDVVTMLKWKEREKLSYEIDQFAISLAIDHALDTGNVELFKQLTQTT